MRHKLLEQYVDEVSVGLNRLPAHERILEIEEMKEHLESLAVANEEMGDTEEQAAKNALRQFGNARQIAQGLRKSYQRKVRKSFRMRDTLAGAFGAGILSTAISGIAVMLLLPWLYTIAPVVGYQFAPAQSGGNWAAYLFVFYTKTLLFGGLMAFLTRRMAQKRAVEGTVLSLLFLTVIDFMIRLAVYNGSPMREYGTHTVSEVYMPVLLDKESLLLFGVAFVVALAMQYRQNYIARRKAVVA